MIQIKKRYLPLLMIVLFTACNNLPKHNGSDNDNVTATEKEQSMPEANDDGGEASNEQNIRLEASKENPGSLTISLPDDNTPKEQPEQAQEQEQAQDREVAYLFNKGTTAFNNDDFENGVDYFEQIIAKNPGNRKAYYNLGLGYFELNRFRDALSSFNKAIDLEPRDSLSIQYRGRVYYMLGDFEKCLRDYDMITQMKPNDYIAWYNRGTAKGQLKDYLGAIKDFDKAIELNPEYAEAYYNRGLANFFQGRRHEACYDWRKAHSLGHYESEKALRSYCQDEE